MKENSLDLNTAFVMSAIYHDINKSVFSITNTKFSLILEAIEASNIETNENGAFLSFKNNQNINLTSICCFNCTTTGDSLFLYVDTPKRAFASFLSFDSSISKSSDYGVYFTDSTSSNVNISRIETYSCPGFFLYGASSGVSNVSYYTISNAFTPHGDQISQSSCGHHTWQKFNTINCSNFNSKFKSGNSVTFLRNVVFVGNWDPSGGKPVMIWRSGGTVTVEDMIIQSNGTMNGVSTGFVTSNSPKIIDMTLANRMHCRALINRAGECTLKGDKSKILPILFPFFIQSL